MEPTSDVAVEDVPSTTDAPAEPESVDDLLGVEIDDPLLNSEHSGLPQYQDILKSIPEDGRRFAVLLHC